MAFVYLRDTTLQNRGIMRLDKATSHSLTTHVHFLWNVNVFFAINAMRICYYVSVSYFSSNAICIVMVKCIFSFCFVLFLLEALLPPFCRVRARSHFPNSYRVARRFFRTCLTNDIRKEEKSAKMRGN